MRHPTEVDIVSRSSYQSSGTQHERLLHDTDRGVDRRLPSSPALCLSSLSHRAILISIDESVCACIARRYTVSGQHQCPLEEGLHGGPMPSRRVSRLWACMFSSCVPIIDSHMQPRSMRHHRTASTAMSEWCNGIIGAATSAGRSHPPSVV